MGFRYKIGVMNKLCYLEIKNLDNTRLLEWYRVSNVGYPSPYKLAKEVYEIGKYFDEDILKDYLSPLFTNEDVHKEMNEGYRFLMLSQDGLLRLIDYYREKTLDYYKLLKPKEELTALSTMQGISSIEQHIEEQITIWGRNATEYNLPPYNLDLDNDEIVSNWKFEYQVFEIVRVYKSIDFDNQIVTLNAW